MPISLFPDPKNPDHISPEGIIAVGGDLHPDSLIAAYGQGIFPWPILVGRKELPLTWFCPEERAILRFDRLHLPRSLKSAQKSAQKRGLRFTLDQDFAAVIRECARAKRPGQRGTWITTPMENAYFEFHRLGFAHSAEVWEGDYLIGGIYGVAVNGTFAGESMFHRQPNASKLALLFLVEHLRAKGLDWIDIQVMTPHLEALGAEVISRDEFLEKLVETQSKRLPLFP